jgi:hypothetical protein
MLRQSRSMVQGQYPNREEFMVVGLRDHRHEVADLLLGLTQRSLVMLERGDDDGDQRRQRVIFAGNIEGDPLPLAIAGRQ